MRVREIARLVRVTPPPAPYGARRLRRTYSIEDVADAARRRLPDGAMGYLDGGGEGEYTLRRNRTAFDELEIVPTVLHDVSDVDTATTLLGSPAALPLALAPVGAPRLFHHEGERAAARAAAGAGVPHAMSTLATTPLDAVVDAAPDAPHWFQLYLWGDRGIAKDLIGRAASLGYRALLVSVDVTVRSKRERELRAGIKLPKPALTVRTIADGAMHPSWSWHFVTSPSITFPNLAESSGGSSSGGSSSEAEAVGGAGELERMFDGTVAWSDIEWIRECWEGPLAVKGVLSAEDGRRAADMGADGVVVSNHGGRQLDHLPATIDALPGVVDAVGDRVEVLVDSGIRRGTDILTALALGARGVLVGRAYLYGLAAAGEAGVRHCMDILGDELRTAMALSGAPALDALSPDVIRRRPAARNDGRPPKFGKDGAGVA